VVLPVNFETDFASIPSLWRYVFNPKGPWKRAAAVHDSLCNKVYHESVDGLTQSIADNVFHEAMRVDGVNLLVAFWFWFYVRVFSIV
jgi:hypothetical protein